MNCSLTWVPGREEGAQRVKSKGDGVWLQTAWVGTTPGFRVQVVAFGERVEEKLRGRSRGH